MRNRVEAAISRYRMLEGANKVCVALSGGADSVALLCVLNELKQALGIELSAVHINHCLRGDESERDEQFVRQLCLQKGVPLTVHRFDVAALSDERGQSIELAARNIRYGVFDSITADGTLVATAHTVSDNLETVLINMARGTGVKGVGGIPPVRGKIIRPLCDCTREYVESYLGSVGCDYVTDSTNTDTDITRNCVRHLIVPNMKKINPSAERAVLRLSEQCRELSQMVEGMAARLLSDAADEKGLKIVPLSAAERPVLAAALRASAENSGCHELDADHTERLCELVRVGHGRLQLGGAFAEVQDGLLRFVSQPTTYTHGSEQVPLAEGDNQIGNYKIVVKNTQFVHKNNASATINLAKIKGEMVLRTRRGGDSIALPGRPRKSIKKLFCEADLPLDRRETIPVIADDEGVVWVYGFGTDRRVSADEGDRCIEIDAEEM